MQRSQFLSRVGCGAGAEPGARAEPLSPAPACWPQVMAVPRKCDACALLTPRWHTACPLPVPRGSRNLRLIHVRAHGVGGPGQCVCGSSAQVVRAAGLDEACGQTRGVETGRESRSQCRPDTGGNHAPGHTGEPSRNRLKANLNVTTGPGKPLGCARL